MKPLFDPGSFKDPEGRVFFFRDEVYRTLSARAAERVGKLAKSGLLEKFIDEGLLLPCRLVNTADAKLDPAEFGKTLLHHDRIPVLTYPFEWSFEMLRDGALTTLSLLEACLENDFILKDATAYNMAPYQGRMVLFDTLSIDQYSPGTPWDGYAQFCREFLFPLMITAYRGVEFHPWYRGGLGGISLSNAAALFGWKDLFKSGVLRHIMLQSRLEKSFAQSDIKIRDKFSSAHFSKELILANVRNLRRSIKKLRYQPLNSEWFGYAEDNTYSDEAATIKKQFVASALDRLAPGTVVDLGCNTGDYSRIAAQGADRVVAIDIDQVCIDALYRELKHEAVPNIVPMVGNLLNPTPGLGWNLEERRPLFERIGSDAFLALALVHHLRITGNVPLQACIAQFAAIAPAGVIEWVGKDDSMVRKMLRNRSDVYDDYCWENFETLLKQRFRIGAMTKTHGGARVLCELLRK